MSLDTHSSKIRVAVLCGARSAEHEVSLISAHNVVKAIDQDTYEVFVVGIAKNGEWRHYSSDSFVQDVDKGVGSIRLSDTPLSGRLAVRESSHQFYDVDSHRVAFEADVVLPIVHGTHAEDGLLQGLLQTMDIPFASSDCLGSSIAFDKDVSYRLLRDAGLPIAPFITLRNHQTYPSLEAMQTELQTEVIFVKPAKAGSSVGVSRVTTPTELVHALDTAFQYDTKVIIQAAVSGSEVEVAVTGSFGAIEASLPGEITVKNPDDFYSYENKYSSDDTVTLSVPADIAPELQRTLQQTAARVCEVLECEGFGRVDFFVTEEGQYFVNEINTLPGFTSISMFPLLWQASGVSYTAIIDRVIRLGIARHDQRITTSENQSEQ